MMPSYIVRFMKVYYMLSCRAQESQGLCHTRNPVSMPRMRSYAWQNLRSDSSMLRGLYPAQSRQTNPSSMWPRPCPTPGHQQAATSDATHVVILDTWDVIVGVSSLRVLVDMQTGPHLLVLSRFSLEMHVNYSHSQKEQTHSPVWSHHLMRR